MIGNLTVVYITLLCFSLFGSLVFFSFLVLDQIELVLCNMVLEDSLTSKKSAELTMMKIYLRRKSRKINLIQLLTFLVLSCVFYSLAYHYPAALYATGFLFSWIFVKI